MTDKQALGVESLQSVLDNMQSVVYVTDVDTYEIVFANKALKSNYPYDIEGKKCWQVLSSFPGPCPYCKVKELVKKPVGEAIIWENYNFDMKAWLHMNESIIKWPDGRKVHLINVNDISDVKKSEQSLKLYKEELESLLSEKTESEQMLKAMSDNLPGSFIFQLKEEEGKDFPLIVYMSKGVESMFGIGPEEFGDDIRPLLSLFHPEDLQNLLAKASTRKAFSIEARIIVPGKKELSWIMFSEIPRRNNLNEIIWDGIATDITERKKMEYELQQSQAEMLRNATLLKEVSDNMTNSAMYRTHLDAEGRICLDYTSSQIENITGIPLKKLSNSLKPIFDNIHPDDYMATLQRLTSTTGSLEEESTEFRYMLHGEERWLRLQSAGTIREDGTVVRDGMISDITTQKRLELQLIAARDKAEESDKLKSTFLANMSHEIRTPMNAIIGFLEFLSSDDDIDRDTQKEYMRIVSDNANQLLKLIGDILDISKIDAGQMKIVTEKMNVNGLLQDIRSSFYASGVINGKGIELIVDEKGQDPEGLFTIDGTRIRQVLNNIIGNAIKFTDKGHVKFGYNVTPDGLHFYVEDTGIGISKSKLENLGKPFHQLHDVSQSAKYGGTGIGLAISTNLVKLMGGTFHVQSEVGKGSLFELTIPCVEIPESMPASDDKLREDVQAKLAKVFDLTGRTIMIVEDIEANMGYLRTLLRQSNATLITVGNGMEAVESIIQHPEIELALMDVRMPEMDGLEATKRIKQMRPDIIVIGQTAYVSYEDQENMKRAGFDDFLPKPVKRAALQEKIIAAFETIDARE